MTDCTRHQAGLVTLADGELHLVPESTIAHVRGCSACQEEVAAYSELARHIRETLVTELEFRRPVPPRLRLIRLLAPET
jgi:hypothetical protein